ncbi:type II toxin-antitoxin system HicA family toxin [Sphingosinicella soli]|uniref:type II toxin-antitoxin system HicA family toxin n=1 Tax=Sphingosinicella soli TaxID=333708 RepID=UPI001FB0F7B8|nr:type II toxin-antitoxin system HicA family toxin [Sphingosinicella soli]
MSFRDFQRALKAFGFELDRTRGSHMIYVHPHVPRPFSVQRSRKDVKPYQIHALLALVKAHGLHIKA